jgi:hypothetical protein
MPKYRAMIEGRNFLLNLEGRTRRFGFYQTVFVESAGPDEAEADAIAHVRADTELQQMARNERSDPPMLYLDALYELEGAEPLPSREGRTYYVEKKWWQFWR